MGQFEETIQKRRSVYSIGDTLPISDDALDEMLRTVTKNVPSAYNGQSQRVVLLLGEKHKKLWDIVTEAIRLKTGKVGDGTAKKLAAFAAGHGSILFFDDDGTTKKLQEQFPKYADNFATWSQQQNGMLQYAVWCALAEANIGASLQHYNPIIDGAVKAEYGLPESWKLYAQMPFGAITAPPGPKEFLPLDERYRVLR